MWGFWLCVLSVIFSQRFSSKLNPNHLNFAWISDSYSFFQGSMNFSMKETGNAFWRHDVLACISRDVPLGLYHHACKASLGLLSVFLVSIKMESKEQALLNFSENSLAVWASSSSGDIYNTHLSCFCSSLEKMVIFKNPLPTIKVLTIFKVIIAKHFFPACCWCTQF